MGSASYYKVIRCFPWFLIDINGIVVHWFTRGRPYLSMVISQVSQDCILWLCNYNIQAQQMLTPASQSCSGKWVRIFKGTAPQGSKNKLSAVGRKKRGRWDNLELQPIFFLFSWIVSWYSASKLLWPLNLLMGFTSPCHLVGKPLQGMNLN